jgi:hypothetical protein
MNLLRLGAARDGVVLWKQRRQLFQRMIFRRPDQVVSIEIEICRLARIGRGRSPNAHQFLGLRQRQGTHKPCLNTT